MSRETPAVQQEIDTLYAEGVDAWRAGDFARAMRDARSAIELDPSLPAPHYLLGCAELDAGRWEAAVAAFRRCVALEAPYPLRHEAALRAALARARRDLASGAQAGSVALPERLPQQVSIVICSARPERLARSRADYERAFCGIEHEIVAIRDARSLAEGANRGLRAARGELVVFSHDDVALAAPDFAARLLRHMEAADLVGVAGTTRAVTSSWLGAGWPHLAGQIATPGAEGRLTVTVHGNCGLTCGAQALDGVFLACRRELAERIGFDAETFDGWHGYDFDFSFRAHLAGYRCAVAGDLLLVHDSTGAFDTPEWRRYAGRALSKHRAALPPGAGLPLQPQLCSLEVRSADEWRLMTEHGMPGR